MNTPNSFPSQPAQDPEHIANIPPLNIDPEWSKSVAPTQSAETPTTPSPVDQTGVGRYEAADGIIIAVTRLLAVH